MVNFYFLSFFFNIEVYKKVKIILKRVPIVAQQLQTRLVSMRVQVPSLASLSGLRIQPCRELWCRSQTWLRSGMAAAVA